jgi:hypothetical protein
VAEDVGALVARVIADQAGFRSDMAAMARMVETNTAKMNASLARIGKASDALSGSFRVITRVAAAFGVAISGRAVAQFSMQAINAAAELQNLSVRLNASVESLSELQHVARVNDIEFASFSKSLQTMAKNFGEASKGSRGMQDTFRQLGIDFRLLSASTVDVQLEAVAEALARTSDEGQRAALAQEVLGRGGAEMLQAFGDGAEGVRKLRQELRDLNGVTSGETAKAADDAKDAIDRLSASTLGLKNALAAELAPALASATDWLREAFFPTDSEALITGTTARIKKIQEEISAEASKQVDQLAARDNVGWIDRLLGLDEAEWDRRIAETRDRMAALARQHQQATAGLAGITSPGSTAAGTIPGLVTPGSGGDGLADIEVAAERIEVMRSMEQMFQTQIREQRDTAMAENVARMQQEVAAWDEFVQERKAQEADLAAYQSDVRLTTLSQTGSAFETLMSLSQGHSKKMFQLAKAGAIANAVVFAYEGIARTMKEYPYPYNIAMAAAHGVAAFAQVQRIRATSFGGGGTASLGAAASPSMGSSGSAGMQQSQSSQNAITPHKKDVIEIHLHGDFYGFDDYMERRLVEAFSHAVNDRDVVFIRSDSAQGRLLAAGA